MQLSDTPTFQKTCYLHTPNIGPLIAVFAGVRRGKNGGYTVQTDTIPAAMIPNLINPKTHQDAALSRYYREARSVPLSEMKRAVKESQRQALGLLQDSQLTVVRILKNIKAAQQKVRQAGARPTFHGTAIISR